MGKRVAVVLAGCGVFDGSEIHEASAVLVHLSRQQATVSLQINLRLSALIFSSAHQYNTQQIHPEHTTSQVDSIYIRLLI